MVGPMMAVLIDVDGARGDGSVAERNMLVDVCSLRNNDPHSHFLKKG